MPITISSESRKQAITSLQRYFDSEMDEPIGNLVADGLLDFFIKELGPVIYNQAVSDVQSHLLARVTDVDMEIFEDEFQYWRD